MNTGDYEPIVTRREKDPALFTAFVEYKLKQGAGKDEVVRQLIENKGMSSDIAIPLVNSVAIRLELQNSSKLVDISTFFFAVLSGAVCTVIGLIAWFISEAYLTTKIGIGPGLCCFIIGFGISMSARNRTGIMTLIIGFTFALTAIILGELFIRDVFEYCSGFAPPGVSESVYTTCVIGQFKSGIYLDKIGIGIGLAICYFLLGKKSRG